MSDLMNALIKIWWEVTRKDKAALAGLAILLFFIVLALIAPYVIPYDPDATGGPILQPPSVQHWFGTTSMGRDVFSQVIVGTQTALLVGFTAALLSTGIGTCVGLVSGYFGGKTDIILMRIVDLTYAFPLIPFAIILASILRPSVWSVVIAISALMWRGPARTIRAQTLSVAKRPYIKAAKVAGASNLRTIFYHIAPNVLPLTLIYLASEAGWAIIGEASLSFVGLGDPTLVSWGQILHMCFVTGAVRTAWWWMLPPGICIMLLVTSMYLASRSLQQVANPQMRTRKP